MVLLKLSIIQKILLIFGAPKFISQKLYKRYTTIDQNLARHFKYNGAGLLFPPSLSKQSKKLPRFLIQRSPSISKHGCNFSQLWNPYTLYSSYILEFSFPDTLLRTIPFTITN